ncbi:hypothetical protein R3P38DRAFT_3223955 [Favolaschia claudopus]|uniref:Uncharacterized protein n=1 Tax=Favolaschia claudopus TaxID=2862362 RepID=A0AAV9ZWB0_9AGAR
MPPVSEAIAPPRSFRRDCRIQATSPGYASYDSAFKFQTIAYPSALPSVVYSNTTSNHRTRLPIRPIDKSFISRTSNRCLSSILAHRRPCPGGRQDVVMPCAATYRGALALLETSTPPHRSRGKRATSIACSPFPTPETAGMPCTTTINAVVCRWSQAPSVQLIPHSQSDGGDSSSAIGRGASDSFGYAEIVAAVPLGWFAVVVGLGRGMIVVERIHSPVLTPLVSHASPPARRRPLRDSFKALDSSAYTTYNNFFISRTSIRRPSSTLAHRPCGGQDVVMDALYGDDTAGFYHFSSQACQLPSPLAFTSRVVRSGSCGYVRLTHAVKASRASLGLAGACGGILRIKQLLPLPLWPLRYAHSMQSIPTFDALVILFFATSASMPLSLLVAGAPDCVLQSHSWLEQPSLFEAHLVILFAIYETTGGEVPAGWPCDRAWIFTSSFWTARARFLNASLTGPCNTDAIDRSLGDFGLGLDVLPRSGEEVCLPQRCLRRLDDDDGLPGLGRLFREIIDVRAAPHPAYLPAPLVRPSRSRCASPRRPRLRFHLPAPWSMPVHDVEEEYRMYGGRAAYVQDGGRRVAVSGPAEEQSFHGPAKGRQDEKQSNATAVDSPLAPHWLEISACPPSLAFPAPPPVLPSPRPTPTSSNAGMIM